MHVKRNMSCLKLNKKEYEIVKKNVKLFGCTQVQDPNKFPACVSLTAKESLAITTLAAHYVRFNIWV